MHNNRELLEELVGEGFERRAVLTAMLEAMGDPEQTRKLLTGTSPQVDCR